MFASPFTVSKSANHLPFFYQTLTIYSLKRLVYATIVLAVALSYLQFGGRTLTDL
jgi:hypothetical protein